VYLQYLDVLISAQSGMVHNELPRECRITKDYEKCVIQFHLFVCYWNSRVCNSYIKTLSMYLTSFLRRSQPLADYESQRVEQEAEFEKKWEAGEIEGWEDQIAPKAESNGSQEGIWCSACKSSFIEPYAPGGHAHLNH
jgi:splicing factor 3A subunit 3